MGTTTSTTYYDTGLVAGTQYCYTVAAYDNSGNVSAQSTSTCATTAKTGDLTAPSLPGAVAATAVSSSQINVSWSASTDTGGSGLAGYRVYSSGVLLGTTTATSYAHTGLSAGTQHCYTIAAYDVAGNASAQTAQVCASTVASADITPPSVTLTSPTSGATLSGTITLTASASDNVGVTRVEFYADGMALGSATVAPYSISYDTTSTSNGSHTFGSKAYDAAGNWSTSVNINANTSNTASLSAQCLLSLRFGGTMANWDAAFPTATRMDRSGNVIVAGYFRNNCNLGGGTVTSLGAEDCFIVKYSSTGGFVWSRRFGSTGGDAIYGMALDSSDNVVVVGTFNGSVDFGGTLLTSAGSADIFVAKYSTTGGLLWANASAEQARRNVRAWPWMPLIIFSSPAVMASMEPRWISEADHSP